MSSVSDFIISISNTKEGYLPNYYDYPKNLYCLSGKDDFFSIDLIRRIKDIQNYTNPKNIWKYSKNTFSGWEYAFYIVYFMGQFSLSKVQNSSDYTSSSVNIDIRVYTSVIEKNKIKDEILIDSTYKITKVWDQNEINNRNSLIKKGVLTPKVVGIFHTHPYYQDELGNKYYGFFSSFDLQTLISSNIYFIGLVTDKIYLLFCFGRKNSNFSRSELLEVSKKENTKDYLNSISSFCRNNGFVCYFSDTLNYFNLDKVR